MFSGTKKITNLLLKMKTIKISALFAREKYRTFNNFIYLEKMYFYELSNR